MSTITAMSEDAKAIVLLCGRLGGREESQPLRQREYNDLVAWLIEQQRRPADLLHDDVAAEAATGVGLQAGRLAALLGRGVQLGFAVEKWNQSGLWVICRSDPDYPVRFKEHLRKQAPPILFGAGDRALLVGGGLAIVGSRDVDDVGEQFTRDVGAWCARHGLPVVSGGARGVDQTAMSAALEWGGAVIGVLADTLLRRSVARDARSALSDGRLLLISPYHPEAGFSAGAAMGRNKLVYAMADHVLVVSATHKKGGTWEGAVEELRRDIARPVFVRTSGSVPPGNEKLLPLGARPFPDWVSDDDPGALLATAAASASSASGRQGSLFDVARERSSVPDSVRESAPQSATAAEPTIEPRAAAPPASVYEAVLPLILTELDDAIAADELAVRLAVKKAQLSEWLRRAVEEKHVTRLPKPARYIRRGA